MKKEKRSFFKGVMRFLAISMLLLSMSTTVLAGNTDTAVIFFEGVGRYYISTISGSNYFNYGGYTGHAANEHINIPELTAQDTTIYNSSADTIFFDYSNTSVEKAILTYNFNDLIAIDTTFEPRLLKLDNNLNIVDSLELYNKGTSSIAPTALCIGYYYNTTSYSVDVTDFVSKNGEGIYAMVNIPNEFPNIACSSSADWRITTVLESPELPISYTLAVLRSVVVFQTPWTGPGNTTDTFTIKSSLFETQSSGTINAYLLMEGWNTDFFAFGDLTETILIEQYTNGGLVDSSYYYSSMHPSTNVFYGSANSTRNDTSITSNKIPSAAELNADTRIGATTIIDKNFGNFLKNDIDEIRIILETQEAAYRSGEIAVLGLTIQINAPIYEMTLTHDKIRPSDIFFKDEIVQHRLTIENISKDPLGLWNSYVDIEIAGEFQLLDTDVYINSVKVDPSKITKTGNTLRIDFGQGVDFTTLPTDGVYSINFTSKVISDVPATGLIVKAVTNGDFLTNTTIKHNGALLTNVASVTDTLAIDSKPTPKPIAIPKTGIATNHFFPTMTCVMGIGIILYTEKKKSK